ncbi:MAG TPA: NUDIX hydrolase [Caulobacteraceae bacterium]|jgi:8-oxo-dGTP pyrophosphatase MutT (NUDIX family)
MNAVKSVKADKSVGIQYAALAYRLEGRQVQILLITSRGTKRWVIPKGWPMTGLKPEEAAAVEAAEEAGIIGTVEHQPLGSYRYLKRLSAKQSTPVQVIVFPFHVEDRFETWKEQGQRVFEWFSYRKAAALVDEPSLKRLIRDFGAQRSSSLIGRSLRRYRSWRLGAALN